MVFMEVVKLIFLAIVDEIAKFKEVMFVYFPDLVES